MRPSPFWTAVFIGIIVGGPLALAALLVQLISLSDDLRPPASLPSVNVTRPALADVSRSFATEPDEFCVKPSVAVAAPALWSSKRERFRLAIVVDDLGPNARMAEAFIMLEPGPSLSILPRQRYSRLIARRAHARGREVLLHLPMEPEDYPQKDPGTGSLLVEMAREEIGKRVRAGFNDVPFAAGFNNHMGSRLTRDVARMKDVFESVNGRLLFFLDSRTTPGSVAKDAAREAGLPVASRSIFLDNERSGKAIRRQFGRLLEIARKGGSAIGICHPYPETLAVLRERLPRLAEEGFILVPVADLTR